MKRKLCLFIENICFPVMLSVCVLSFIFVVIHCFLTSLSNDTITSIGVLGALASIICTIIYHNKSKRVQYAVELLKEFDCADLRLARRFTRAIKPLFENGDIAPEDLKCLIENANNSKRINKLKKKIEKNLGGKLKSQNLKDSLIYLLNYWQRVYTSISYNLADEDYLIHHLSFVYHAQYQRFSYWIESLSENNDSQQNEDLKIFDKKCEKYLESKNDSLSKKISRLWNG